MKWLSMPSIAKDTYACNPTIHPLNPATILPPANDNRNNLHTIPGFSFEHDYFSGCTDQRSIYGELPALFTAYEASLAEYSSGGIAPGLLTKERQEKLYNDIVDGETSITLDSTSSEGRSKFLSHLTDILALPVGFELFSRVAQSDEEIKVCFDRSTSLYNYTPRYVNIAFNAKEAPSPFITEKGIAAHHTNPLFIILHEFAHAEQHLRDPGAAEHNVPHLHPFFDGKNEMYAHFIENAARYQLGARHYLLFHYGAADVKIALSSTPLILASHIDKLPDQESQAAFIKRSFSHQDSHHHLEELTDYLPNKNLFIPFCDRLEHTESSIEIRKMLIKKICCSKDTFAIEKLLTTKSLFDGLPKTFEKKTLLYLKKHHPKVLTTRALTHSQRLHLLFKMALSTIKKNRRYKYLMSREPISTAPEWEESRLNKHEKA
jgi:hypothetical protein